MVFYHSKYDKGQRITGKEFIHSVTSQHAKCFVSTHPAVSLWRFTELLWLANQIMWDPEVSGDSSVLGLLAHYYKLKIFLSLAEQLHWNKRSRLGWFGLCFKQTKTNSFFFFLVFFLCGASRSSTVSNRKWQDAVQTLLPFRYKILNLTGSTH